MKKENNIIRKEFELIKKELRILYNFRYRKLALLIISIIAAYFIFGNPKVSLLMTHIGSWGYVGVFIAGIFFALGFTAPLSAGFFITLNPGSIWLAGILGGIGAMVGDLLIFKFIKFSFMDEFQRLRKTRIITSISDLIDRTLGEKIKVYLMYSFAGILIASPLPDEAGVIMLAGLTKIKTNILAIISFILNTIGILVLLYL